MLEQLCKKGHGKKTYNQGSKYATGRTVLYHPSLQLLGLTEPMVMFTVHDCHSQGLKFLAILMSTTSIYTGCVNMRLAAQYFEPLDTESN